MTSREKFRLFVASYLAAMAFDRSTTHRYETLKRARKIPIHALPSGYEEEQAFEFVAWSFGQASRPGWLSMDEAEECLYAAQKSG